VAVTVIRTDSGNDAAWSPEYSDAINELEAALWMTDTKPELRERVGRLLASEFNNFVDVCVYPSSTGVVKGRCFLKPRDSFSRLIAAVRTNDCDEIGVLEHSIRS
jgi:hypothetical protein